jgi:hypothetical protein
MLTGSFTHPWDSTCHMNCLRLREILPLYAGKDLDGSTALDVRNHLAVCRQCQKLSEAFGRQTHLLRDYGQEISLRSDPPDFWSHLRPRLRSSIRDPLSPFYRPPAPF